MSSITLNTVVICCLCIPCLIASVCAKTTDYKTTDYRLWSEQTFGKINVMSAFTVKHVKTKVYVGL